MILHIPHASINTLGKRFLCDINLEIERMTDVDTDKLFNNKSATKIIFPVSRLICDVERFVDDELEVMALKGMGVCYTTNSFGNTLREVTSAEKKQIIQEFYNPHHEKLTVAVRKELEKENRSLLIDCHSFSNMPLPHEDSKHIPRPDFCIGTDDYHTPVELLNVTKEYFLSKGYTVSINDPFAGTLIPMEYYHSDNRVSGIMLEVNRDVYKKKFSATQATIMEWLDIIKEVHAKR